MLKKVLGSAVLFLFIISLLIGCSNEKAGEGEEVAATSSSNFPTKPITWIVPFDPGSVTDLVTRLIADEMSAKLDTPVVIENLPGGGTVPGHVKVAQAKADGYTVGTGFMAVEITLHQEESTISSLDDLDVLSQFGEYTAGISVSADSNIESLEDLAEYAEGEDQITVAPSASGSITHLWWDLVAEHYGIDDYGLMSTTGGNDAILKLIAGDAGVVSTPLANVVEHVQAGDVRTLAVTTQERVPGMEDVPTLDELGIDNPLSHNLMLIAPKGTPDDVKEIFISTLEEIMEDPEIQKEIENMQLSPVFLKGEDLDQKIKDGREAINQIMGDS